MLLGIFHLQKTPENFYWEFPFAKNMFHLSQVPFVHRPLSVASLNLLRIFKLEANEAIQNDVEKDCNRHGTGDKDL